MSKEFEEKVLSILEEHSIALKTINEHTKNNRRTLKNVR